MLTKDTVFIEITGVFGAGYVPKLMVELKQHLVEGLRLKTDQGARELNILSFVDNELAKLKNIEYRDRLNDLILRAKTLSPSEREELVKGLYWVDGLVLEFVRNVRKPVDLVLRRGGVLQAFPLIANETWRRINADRRPQPKIPIFVCASQEVTKNTFDDPAFKKKHRQNEESYCADAARAYELQEEWWENLSDLPGVLRVERIDSNDALISQLTKVIQKGCLPHNKQLIPWRRVFISYAHAELELAAQLTRALEKYQVECWFAHEHLRTSQEFRTTFKSNIRERDAFLVIASNTSLSRDWVKFETSTALQLEHDSGRPIVFPLRIDRTVLDSNEPLAVQLRQRQVADFCGWKDASSFDSSVSMLIRDLLDLEGGGSENLTLTTH